MTSCLPREDTRPTRFSPQSACIVGPVPSPGGIVKSVPEAPSDTEQSCALNPPAFMLPQILQGPELQIQFRFADRVRPADDLQLDQVHSFALGAEVLREAEQPQIGRIGPHARSDGANIN